MSRRSDPVTPEVREIVIARDRHEMRLVAPNLRIVCVAPIIDQSQIGLCWGRTTLDHIKPEPRMGPRARSIPEQLVSVCQGHSEDGMRAGYQWNTAHRPELRDHLARTTRICIRCGGYVIGSRCNFCGLEASQSKASSRDTGESGG